MFDLHCHVLPGLDDGAGTMEEALKMLEKSVSCGVKGVIATPHSYMEHDRGVILSTLNALRTEAKNKHIPIRIYAGEELLLDERGLFVLQSGQAVPINGSRYLLVEFGFEEEREKVFYALSQVRACGLIPIVAHPERYAFFCEDARSAGELRAQGCLLQVNRGSILGRHGQEAQAVAWHLLKNREADFVASDAHSPYLRTPELNDVHQRISLEISFDYAEQLLRINPGRVLRNERIPG